MIDSRSEPSPGAQPPPAPGWKVLLALLSLSLSALLWFDGLSGSLERPSVGSDLELRQLELSALTTGELPQPLEQTLSGEEPRSRLAQELRRQIETAGATPPAAVHRLELALLERESPDTAAAAESSLRELVPMVDAPRRALLEALLAGERIAPAQQRQLLEPWNAPLLVRQLSCEQLGGPESSCPAVAGRNGLLLRLLALTALPPLLLLGGIILLVRELWLLRQGRSPVAPRLVGPPLTLVDASLLIFGGFVLIGEVLLPGLLQPLLQGLIGRLVADPAVAQGLEVFLLYLSLTMVPLFWLWRLLPAGAAPPGGWLQWGWRPAGPALRQAVAMLLGVLPLVAATGWLIHAIWKDPGGSNPMLELVLQGSNPVALLCFAGTALLLAPLFEEVLFRGVLLPVLGQWLGPAWAVLVSAALFAAAHLSLSELMPLFVLGSGLGLLRWRSGRLAPSVLMHACWNTLTFLNLLLLGS